MDNYLFLDEYRQNGGEYIIPDGVLNTLLIDIENLQQENKKYKEVIDRAIKYINSNPNVYYDEHLIDVETLKASEMTDEVVGEVKFISKLLDILGKVK